MSPTAFIEECFRRDIRLSLATPRVASELPRIIVEGTRKPPEKVLDTIRKYKPKIIEVLLAEGTPVVLPGEQDELAVLGREVDTELAPLMATLPLPPVLARWQFLDLLSRADACALPLVPLRLSQGIAVADPNAFVAASFARAERLQSQLDITSAAAQVAHIRDELIGIKHALCEVQEQLC